MIELGLVRKVWRTLEPYHGMIYFVPEARNAYAALGLSDPRMGYFASRSAAFGPVAAQSVIATFFNFNPALVHKAIPAAWEQATPAQILKARYEAADMVLQRVLGEAVKSPEMMEAANLARQATTGCSLPGRPLYAAHASLPWPDEAAPHLVLWHAQTLLREYRGDGHIAALVVEGVSGCEALVLHAATGAVSAQALRVSRGWSDEEWAATGERLRERGWLTQENTLSEAGQAHRDWVEERTDQLALAPYAHLGQAKCERLRELVRPFSKALVAAEVFPVRLAILED